MTVLCGHPTGTPFAHHAALAHYEAGWLERFCVPWMPSAVSLSLLERAGPLRDPARRLARRRFPELADAPKIQGRFREFRRLLLRLGGLESDKLIDEANDWVMQTMARNAGRAGVTALHAYEDCAEDAFAAAVRHDQACVYDLPIGYYAAWARTRQALAERYSSWIAEGRSSPSMPEHTARKLAEMELADIVLAPSQFVAQTVREFHPDKQISIAPYGVDLYAWPFADRATDTGCLTFLFAGQCSVRKGVPLLLEAWRAANLKNARLNLVGSWRLADAKKGNLPPGATWRPPVGAAELRRLYAEAGVFVFPTNFEGRALVVLEALASGLPVLTTEASGASDAVGEAGKIIAPDDLDAMVEALRWFDRHRDDLPGLGRIARANAEACSWSVYRQSLVQAVRPFV